MSNDPATESAEKPVAKPAKSTSARKAESNRRNAQKSTGPRTAQGKSWSRRNALKHGVLASQAVLTMVEGSAERKAFEQMVEGLAHDFAPVGTFEQVLVQQIAACIWRQRRLLMFENRAAFRSRDNRTFTEMNEPQPGLQPLYLVGKHHREGADVLDEAGLGLDLPSERDTMRLIRYEASITRSLRNALAQLKAFQQARRAAAVAANAPSFEDRAVVVDSKSLGRNGQVEACRLSAKKALVAHAVEMREREEEEELMREEEVAEAAENGSPTSEDYQTNPNILEDPKAMERHQRMMETADRVMRLSASLAPKRRPSED